MNRERRTPIWPIVLCLFTAIACDDGPSSQSNPDGMGDAPIDIALDGEGVSVFDIEELPDGAMIPPAPCPAGQSQCGDGCVDLLNDAENCGACGQSCDGRCANGSCTIGCDYFIDANIPVDLLGNARALYDMDGDGDLDILTADDSTLEVVSDPWGLMTRTRYELPSRALQMEVFRTDDQGDLLVVHGGLDLFVLNLPDLTSLAQISAISVDGFALGDVDGEGTTDLVYIDSGTLSVHWGITGEETVISDQGASFDAIAVRDLDGDNGSEIAAWRDRRVFDEPVEVVVYDHNGNAFDEAKLEVDFGETESPISIVAPILTPNTSPTLVAFTRRQTLQLTYTGGALALSDSRLEGIDGFHNGTPQYTAEIADVDGDGDEEILAQNRTFLRILGGTDLSARDLLIFGQIPPVVGDINGDGRPDLVGVHGVIRQEVDGSFGRSERGTGVQLENTTLIDIDGDGTEEVVGSSLGHVGFYRQDAMGNLGEKVMLYDLPAGQTFVLIDVDNDGDQDLYIGTPNEVVFAEQTAPGAFGPKSVVLEDKMVLLTAMPFGDNSILAARPLQRAGGIEVYHLNPDGSLGTIVESIMAQDSAMARDANGDGVLDLVTSSQVRFVESGPALGSPIEIAGYGTNWSFFDVDGDGELDALGNGEIAYKRSGVWSEPETASGLGSVLSTADIQGDGRISILNADDGKVAWMHPCEGCEAPDLGFSSLQEHRLSANFAGGRVFLDQNDDIVLTEPLFMRVGREGTQIDDVPFGSPRFRPLDTMVMDGKHIVVGNIDSGESSAALAAANDLSVVPTEVLGFKTQQFVKSDFDQDGQIDLAFANRQSGTEDYGVVFGDDHTNPMYADGNLGLTFITSISDVNGDGWVDIGDGNGDTHLSLGTRVGWSTPLRGPSVEYVGNQQSFRLGDVDGDGDMDALVQIGDELVVRRNFGAGWVDDQRLTIESTAARIVIADLDQDGRLDLLVPGTVGDESGTFVSWGDEGAFEVPRLLSPDDLTFVSDIDGSGGLEIGFYRETGEVITQVIEREVVDWRTRFRSFVPMDVDGDGVTDWVSQGNVLFGSCR